MTFDEQLRITLLDKGLLAAILTLAAFALNWLLERRKARNELLKAISLQRVDAYKKLWALLEAVRPSDKADIPDPEMDRLAVALTNLDYEDGGGLFLSHAAAGQCIGARGLLERHAGSRGYSRAVFTATITAQIRLRIQSRRKETSSTNKWDFQRERTG